MTEILQQIRAYHPEDAFEAADQALMVSFLSEQGDFALYRACRIAHITSSGFVMNKARTRMLMVYHNILDSWAWTGGHADGDSNLLAVALREAEEETGAHNITPLSDHILSLDVLTVPPHWKRGEAVSAHLHLSVAYLLCCDEAEQLTIRPEENSGVSWFDADLQAADIPLSLADSALYSKLVRKARRM